MIETGRALQQGFPLLFWTTILTALLLVPSLALLGVDSRLVTGVNPWLKPIKFELSIAVFNVTVGWMLLRLHTAPASSRTIAAVVALAMFVEIAALMLQAARGVPSHYNNSTPFNAAVFSAMAIAIVANTAAVAWLCLLSFQPQPQLPPAVVWGIRLGLILFLLSSLQGFQMVANHGHTVGAADGGPGLPLLRWSTVAGDLRVAHFAGLHAIQVLPLLGYLTSRADRQAGIAAVAAAFLALAAFTVWSLAQAWAGRPLWPR